MRVRPLLLALLCAAVSGCGAGSGPAPRTAADSLAVRIADAAGGAAALDALPVLRFDWAVVADTAERVRRRHLWDRAGDRYRVEWPAGADSTLVALFAPSAFDPAAPAGQVALNGTALAGAEAAERLGEAYEAYINDAYWLLAPMKLMDPGVTRALAPDSGAAVLAVSFDGVGLTPGDRYWIFADETSGAMTGWSFVLEGDTAVGRWDWTDPEPIATPRGTLLLPTVKTSADGARAILTLPYPAPEDDGSLWTDLRPRLLPGR